MITRSVARLPLATYHLPLIFGDHKAVVRPDPIPNSAVKHSLADGSGSIGSARVGCRQIFQPKRRSGAILDGVFAFFLTGLCRRTCVSMLNSSLTLETLFHRVTPTFRFVIEQSRNDAAFLLNEPASYLQHSRVHAGGLMDLKDIKAIVDLMKKNSISEFEL